MKAAVIDEYAHLESPVHRWELRCKLIGFLVLIFAFSYVRDPVMLLAMIAVTTAVYLLSGLPPSYLLRRLRYPSFFLLVMVLVLPFISGQTVLFSLGPLALKQEGLFSVLLIAVRFLSILTVGLVLFGTAPFMDTIKAMRALGLPAIMADIVFLSFRYLHEIGSDLLKMQTAARLRGFHHHTFSLKNLSVPAWLSGSILVRSYERSEWVYKAMILRGYAHNFTFRNEFRIRTSDIVTLIVFLLIAAGFVAGDILFGHGAAGLLQ
ncbi:MAG: cobalt ECF transporter T component CbiQ [Dehalococcoidales bacterium]|nr:cobalt ECF transporter T component CbiQ [Dehalococcoidales bacterium]